MGKVSFFRVPHWAWWVSIAAGLAAVTVCAFRPSEALPFPLPGSFLQWLFARETCFGIFVFAVAAHALEALYSVKVSMDCGLNTKSTVAWFLQTSALGMPSLSILLSYRKKVASSGNKNAKPKKRE
jgi:hypothetical protein